MAEKKTEPKVAKGSGGKLKLILLILIVLLILAAGAGAAWYFLLRTPPDQAGQPEEKAEAPAPEPAKPEHESAPVQEPEHAPLIYHALAPVTVNIAAPGPARFLKLSITVVTRDERVVAALDKHMPMIRNDLLTRLSGQTYAMINTPEGKNALREELKKMFYDLLVKAHEPADIQNLLFTDLVMQ